MIERVKIENLRSHSRTEIEFREGINVLVGPNGAGKTTVLEAITLALFPRTFRSYDHMIREGERRAVVEVVFWGADGRRYRVRREFYRGGGQRDPRLYREENDGWKVVASGRAEDVDREVMNALGGVDRDVFREAVYIRQGEIAKLVEATREERKRIVDRTLGLAEFKRARERAHELLRVAEAKLETFRERVRDLKGSEKELRRVERELEELKREVKELEPEVEELKERLDELREVKREFEELESESRLLRNEIQSLERRRDDFRKLVEEGEDAEKELRKLGDVPSEVRELEDERAELRKRIEELRNLLDDLRSLRNRLESAEEELEGVKRELEKLREEAGVDPERLVELKDVIVEASERLRDVRREEELKRELEKIRDELNELREREEALQSEYEELQERLDGIQGELKEIKVRERELRERIEGLREAEGECPVCLRKLPRERAEELLRDAERELERLREHEEDLREERRELEDRLESVKKELERAREKMWRREERREKLERELGKIEEIKGELADLSHELGVEEDRLPELRDLAVRAEGLLKELERRREDVLRLERELERTLGRCGEVIGRTPSGVEDVEGELRRLEEERDRVERELREAERKLERYRNLEEKVERARKAREELDKIARDLEDAKGRLERVERDLERLRERYGSRDRVEEELEEVEEEYEKVRDKLSEVKGRLSEMEKRREDLKKRVRMYREARERKERLERVVEVLDLCKEVFRHSRDVARERVLPAVEREASKILQDLSDRYGSLRIEEDGAVIRVSVPGGHFIEADRMSGGEKIIIGLALRLALAMVGSSFAPFIMLDEPTVHLDAEHRERLAQALRELELGKGRVRQAIVVTHDEELEDAADELWRIENRAGESRVERYSG
ncbi:AAA family ATPase [Methanopyrus sp.]